MIQRVTQIFFTLLIGAGLMFSCTARFTSQSSTLIPAKEDALRAAAERWLGVPYRYGGNSKQGIDCSGLAVQLYQEVFKKNLPRQSAQQRTLGYSVHVPYLKPGDLLFFRFEGQEGIEHVGVYLGQGQFVHASRTRGVVIDHLSAFYYKQHLVVARRVLH